MADPLRALIITARRGLAEELRDLLERSGCEVVVARDGKTAAELVQAQPLDMILVDRRVEGAVDFAAHVRPKPRAPLLIAVSDEALRDDERVRLGAVGFTMVLLTSDPRDLTALKARPAPTRGAGAVGELMASPAPEPLVEALRGVAPCVQEVAPCL